MYIEKNLKINIYEKRGKFEEKKEIKNRYIFL